MAPIRITEHGAVDRGQHFCFFLSSAIQHNSVKAQMKSLVSLYSTHSLTGQNKLSFQAPVGDIIHKVLLLYKKSTITQQQNNRLKCAKNGSVMSVINSLWAVHKVVIFKFYS